MEQVLSLLQVQFSRKGASSIAPIFFTELQESVGYRDIGRGSCAGLAAEQRQKAEWPSFM